MQQGQDQVRATTARINLDGGSQAVAEGGRSDEAMDGEAPGVPGRDVTHGAVFAEDGVGKIDSPLGGYNDRLAAGLAARRGLSVRAIADVVAFEIGQDALDKSLSARTGSNNETLLIKNAIRSGEFG